MAEHSKKVKITDLPVYGEPTPPELIYEPEKITPYREQVAIVRKFVGDYLSTIQGTTDKIQHKWEVSKAHTKDFVAYLQDDKEAIPKVTFISFTGLLGVLAGLKGGMIRRSVYGLTGGVTGAAICYPHRAVDITASGWNKGVDKAVELWNSTGTHKDTKVEKVDTKTTDEVKKVYYDSVSTKGDPGMSNPADKDMYTTRK